MGRGTMLAAVLAAIGPCGPREPAPTSVDAAAAERTDAENWQRMKDCAARADLMAKQSGWTVGKDGLLDWVNHYSPKHRRCYVQAKRINKGGRELPPLTDELYDAFEERLLAMCTDYRKETAASFCSTDDTHGDCAACRDYIDERMRN